MMMRKKEFAREDVEEYLACACLSLRQAARVTAQLFDDALVPVGLLSSQLPILALLSLYGPLTISRLAALLVMDRTTLTRTLKPLQAKNYIRPIATADKRKNLLELTPQGYQVVVDSHPLWQKAQQQIVRGLKPTAWKTMQKLLGKIVQASGHR
jgi:DNA-binding MarR family transcriptional regulator